MGLNKVLLAQWRLIRQRQGALSSQVVLALIWTFGLGLTTGWGVSLFWLSAIVVGSFGLEIYHNHIGRTFAEREKPRILELLLITIWAIAPSLVFTSGGPESITVSAVMLACGFLIVLGRYRGSTKPAIIMTAPYAVLSSWALYETFGSSQFLYLAVTGVILFGTFITIMIYSVQAQKTIEREKEQKRRLIVQLERAKQKAQESALFKSRFLANMSHELRTPLNGIMGITQILKMNTDDASITEKLDIIDNCGQSLLQIMNDVLDLSKIEANGMSLSPIEFDLRDEISKFSKVWFPQARQKNIVLNVKVDKNTPNFWFGDFNKIRQCLNNLMSNAVKFTDSGGVTLYVGHRELNDAYFLFFKVLDTGIGMSAETQKGLFIPFVQAKDSANRKFGGTGLGMTITKHLCELMEGKITVASQLGLGSNFEITFKINPLLKDVSLQQPDLQLSSAA